MGPTLEQNPLDPTSRELAREIRRNLPRIARHLRQEPRTGSLESYVHLRAPRPVGDGLSLVVDSGEYGRVRVAFGRWSAEYDAPPEGGRHTELPAALDAIEDLAQGRAAAYTMLVEGRFKECGLLRDERDEAALLSRLSPGTRIELVTWEGEGDAVYEG